MLPCKQTRCIWHLVYILSPQTLAGALPVATDQGTQMSKTTAIALAPPASLFGRLLAAIDRLLMKSAEIANRNGDLPRVGL